MRSAVRLPEPFARLLRSPTPARPSERPAGRAGAKDRYVYRREGSYLLREDDRGTVEIHTSRGWRPWTGQP